MLGLAVEAMASGVQITTTSLPKGTVEQSYSAVIEASGGCTPYKWRVFGKLPTGVKATRSSSTTSLNLSGTPTSAANYSFEVEVTGCGGRTATASYEVIVQPAAPVVDLNWDASTSSDIAGYNVYRSRNDATWKKLNSELVPSTVYDDSAVLNGRTYYYSVTAVDTAGVESPRTPAIKVVVP